MKTSRDMLWNYLDTLQDPFHEGELRFPRGRQCELVDLFSCLFKETPTGLTDEEKQFMVWKYTSITTCEGCSRNQVQHHSRTIISLPANLLPQQLEVDVTDLLRFYFSGEKFVTHTCSRTVEGGRQCKEMAFRVNRLEEQGQVLVIEVQKVDGFKVTSKLEMILDGRHYRLLGVAYHHQLNEHSGHFSAIVFRCGGYWYVDGLNPTITTKEDSWTNAIQMTTTHTHDRFKPSSDAAHTSLVVYEQVEVCGVESGISLNLYSS